MNKIVNLPYTVYYRYYAILMVIHLHRPTLWFNVPVDNAERVAIRQGLQKCVDGFCSMVLRVRPILQKTFKPVAASTEFL